MAPPGNKNAVGNPGGGRKPFYKDNFAQMARYACRDGATDADLAELFGVTEVTIGEWKKIHPEFGLALKDEKSIHDEQVEASLCHRAKGYSHPAVKIHVDKDGYVTEVPYTEHYPPDTGAAIFWLKNRQPKRWRDKVDIDLTSAGQPLPSLVIGFAEMEKKPGDDARVINGRARTVKG